MRSNPSLPAPRPHGDPGDDGPAAVPAVELLVHGVGGATPAQMLGDPRTTRVTGDRTAGIHRRTGDAGDRPWDAAAPVREAYSWSNLTSGNGARALWLLLLPFMISNMAHWMRPAGGHRRAQRAYDVLVRLLALSLTVLLVGGACAVCLDLLAWQCAAAPACSAQSTWFGFLSDGGWWSAPGRRLALAAVPPAGVTVLLWWLSHRTWSAYESAYPPVRERADGPSAAPLSLPGFWYGRAVVARLRAAHTAAGLLTVAAALLAATWSRDHGPDGSGWAAATGWALAALLLGCAAAAAAVTVRHGRTEQEVDDRPRPAAVTALPAASGAALLLTAAHSAWDRPGWETAGSHPGSALFTTVALVQGALIAGLALSARHLHRRAAAADRGVLAGLGGPAVATLACALAGVFTGGAVQRFADWLDPGSRLGEPGSIAGPPVLLSWQAAAVPVLLAVVLLAAAAAAAHAHRLAGRIAPGIRARYPGESTGPHPRRSREVAAAIARARLTDSAPLLIGAIVAVALLLGAAAVAGARLTGGTPIAATAGAPGPVAGGVALCQAVGSYLMGIGVVVLVAMGRRAYRDASARRTVGILWDVGTFWPRAAHPFAPPCYAERAVPDLSWRMGTWVDATGGRLVISGHSQGSVLAAAAVWQLDAPTRSRIALLTYGSPLERLYGRWFPAYFGPGSLAGLRADLPGWRNLWRDTDPIGGPVRAGADAEAVDRGPLLDPLYYGRNLRRPLPEPLLGHSGYDEDPAYAEEREMLFRRLTDGPSPPADPARAGGHLTAGGDPRGEAG